MAAPPQFASLSDFTDELMQVRSGDVGHQKFIAHLTRSLSCRSSPTR